MEVVHKRYCTHCKATENLGAKPYSTKKTKSGKRVGYYLCQPCNRDRYRRYYATENGRERVRASVERSIARYTAKQRAREKVRYALEVGKLTKPARCEKCLEDKPLDGHHADYNHPLSVEWLCRLCHTRLHKPLPKH